MRVGRSTRPVEQRLCIGLLVLSHETVRMTIQEVNENQRIGTRVGFRQYDDWLKIRLTLHEVGPPDPVREVSETDFSEEKNIVAGSDAGSRLVTLETLLIGVSRPKLFRFPAKSTEELRIPKPIQRNEP